MTGPAGVTQRNYKRPPIVEAVIEWRLANPIPVDDVERVRRKFAPRFPVVQATQQVRLQLSPPSTGPTIDTVVSGYRMNASDSTEVFVIATTLIAYSALAPYPGWDGFSRGGLATFADVRGILGYLPLARIGMRYLNRLDIPAAAGAAVRLEDYLRIQPQYPEGDLPPLQAFTMQTVFGLTEIGCVATVNVAAVPSPLPQHRGLLLDIDVGRDDAVPQNEPEIEALLDTMRDAKNRVFEVCITDAARALFGR